MFGQLFDPGVSNQGSATNAVDWRKAADGSAAAGASASASPSTAPTFMKATTRIEAIPQAFKPTTTSMVAQTITQKPYSPFIDITRTPGNGGASGGAAGGGTAAVPSCPPGTTLSYDSYGQHSCTALCPPGHYPYEQADGSTVCVPSDQAVTGDIAHHGPPHEEPLGPPEETGKLTGKHYAMIGLGVAALGGAIYLATKKKKKGKAKR